MEKNIVEVKYYNVSVFISINPEKDEYLMPYLRRIVRDSESVTLKTILNWCKNHGLEAETKFNWRKDFPMTANVFNYFTYRHALRESYQS
ncbi:MAG: hypothetical protein K6A30_02245 [Lachnospiraceae bacterium]|nr:hypothetical protein [Lachnospiraceae bacterium]